MATEWVHEWEIYCTDGEGLPATAYINVSVGYTRGIPLSFFFFFFFNLHDVSSRDQLFLIGVF